MWICHSTQNRQVRQGMRPRFAAAVLSLIVLLPGCGGDQIWREKSAVARRHLQLSENEAALGVLSSVDETDAPPEFRYLKSITLYRLGRTEAAGSERHCVGRCHCFVVDASVQRFAIVQQYAQVNGDLYSSALSRPRALHLRSIVTPLTYVMVDEHSARVLKPAWL